MTTNWLSEQDTPANKKMMSRLKGVWPFILLGGVLLLFFHKMAFSNLILGRGDTFLYFYPYWEAAAAALKAGAGSLVESTAVYGFPLFGQ